MSSAAERAARPGLPIDAALPALRAALANGSNAVLQAPPGAGKSTVVPLVLLEEPWARGKRLLMLEPRRLAARAVAERMAATLGEPVGRTVGYRMRFDTRVSRDTRIEVITEGVLTRMLQADPALEGTGIVLFDEFHERSLQADLALALALDAQATVAPELKLLVMSATVDVRSIAEWLGGAPTVTATGRAFPVETRFVGRGAPSLPEEWPRAPGRHESPEQLAARVVQRVVRESEGDVLVFLPGAREIRRVESLLSGAGFDAVGLAGAGVGPVGLGAAGISAAVRILPLYGDLDTRAQDAALAPGPAGKRKVILSTNIAETSLTVEGVRVVVDSGLVRRSVFDPVTGMSRLVTRRISRASADQRQGRAGRLAPGVCYRVWSEEAHRSLAPFSAPEIAEADLSSLALELAAWGVRDAGELRWLDAPPPAMLASARDLLERLGALDGAGRITAHGRDMARLAVHPRLAHMLLEARGAVEVDLATQLAALLSERDMLSRGPEPRDADIRSRLEHLSGGAGEARRDAWAVQRVRKMARSLARQMEASGDSRGEPGGASRGGSYDEPYDKSYDESRGESRDTARAGILLALAYPDRIGLKRGGAGSASPSGAGPEGSYLLANGRGASFAAPQSLARQELIVAVDLDDRERNARILLAAPVERAEFEQRFAERLRTVQSIAWSEREQAVLAQRTVRLDALILSARPLEEIPPEAARTAMLDGIRRMGLDCLPWSREARDFQARVELLRRLDGPPGGAAESAAGSAGGSADTNAWPAMSDAALGEALESWLAPWLDGVTRREHLGRVPLLEALQARLSWEQRRRLDVLAPAHLSVPSGSRVRIDYLDESAPVVAVRLQEVFGLAQTPKIGGGRIPVTFKLLSPAQRAVQITRDLASFWRGAYAEVRKDLRGRYPKHFWPENPLEAEPTRRARPRK